MRRRTALTVLPIALFSVLAWSSPALAAPTNASAAKLTGAREVPGPGDADGVAAAAVLARPGHSTVCINLAYRDIDAPTGAHIHEGSRDVAGPIVVDFTPFIATSRPGKIQGCAVTTPELAADIGANPNDYYVNVHNVAFPAGAIRGQLHG